MAPHEQPDGLTQQGITGLTPDRVTAILARIADPERRLAVHQQLFPDLLNLGTAENVLLYPRLKENVFDELPGIGEHDIRYPVPIYGTQQLRTDIAELLRPLFDSDLRKEDVFGTSGVSAALECLAFALKHGEVLETGDRVLLPAPFWPGFKWCFEQRPGLVCVAAPLTSKGSENFELTLEDLQRAYHAEKEPPKLLVLTNPNNPLGVNYPKDLLEKIYDWALKETQMHIISDEMYAHSQIRTSELPFVSALSLDAYRNDPAARERVHVTWGFAKDFGLSGFKAGVVISRSSVVQDVLTEKSGEPYSWFSPFDSLKHYVLGKLLETRKDGGSFALELMAEYRETLTDAFQSARAAFDRNKIKYVFHKGQNPAQFFWLDLRQYLKHEVPEIPWERGPHFPQNGNGEPAKPGDLRLPVLFSEINSAEEDLRKYIAENAHVQLLPGQAMSNVEPGYFRLCYTAFDKETVREAIDRIGQALASRGQR
ncbi:pyridoxal phosphate-dependent aminotransferase [Streptomyces piniterrae]|uniref:Pyridoxal phosphate-dependent aminotransferase n=1 Tax=Streptomyces piniterrae TaxID=2571125 RepID=A0A4U0NS33_9ACTN|nr:pyridoxal phosphate-dependent aminotransferase [Streptomyces piniterrae]TJZ57409.1 pyridoxal phosphate-dependent aminotransferase [Streptomyces piniterrae]